MASAGARARSKYLHNESKDGDYKDDGELSCEVVPEGVRSKVGHSKVAEPAVWERVDDPSVGMPYYVNKATGESRWEPPEGLSDFVAVPLPPGVVSRFCSCVCSGSVSSHSLHLNNGGECALLTRRIAHQ